MDKNKITLVVPATIKDLPILIKNSNSCFKYLPINRICIIADIEVKKLLPNDSKFEFYDESELLPITALKTMFSLRCENVNDRTRFGWYIQQFLKMAYSYICKDDYYLLWDSDTIPVQNIPLFDNKGKPYLDYKTEYYKPYFDTIKIILPGFRKEYKGSFIAEHMLIKTSCMKSLLDEINTNTNIHGNNVFEKIINSINIKDLPYSGFSEFETYGTYVYKRFPDLYSLRKWESLRYGAFYFKIGYAFSTVDIEWLSKYYHAISIETNQNVSILRHIVATNAFKKVFKANILDTLSIPIRGFRYFKKELIK